MASASSSAARLLIRDGKTAASLLLRARTANLTGTVENTGSAIRSLLWFNQTPASQFPVFNQTFLVMQSGSQVGFPQQEAVSEIRGKMEAAHGKRVVDSDDGNESEEDTDFDDGEFDDIDEDEEFDDIDDEDDDEEEEEYTRKKKK